MTQIWATLNVCLLSANKFYFNLINNNFFNRVLGRKLTEIRNTSYQT